MIIIKDYPVYIKQLTKILKMDLSFDKKIYKIEKLQHKYFNFKEEEKEE